MDNFNLPTDKDESADINQDWNNLNEEGIAEIEMANSEYATSPGGHTRNAMFLMATCVIGMLGVYLFGIRQQPQEASPEEQAVEAKIDLAVAKFMDKKEQNKVQQMFQNTGDLVQTFYEYPSNQQVALEELQKNPFSLVENEGEDDQETSKLAKIKLEKELQKKAQAMELQSVVHGPNGFKCLINGEIFGTGQQIEDTFSVKSIDTESVVLTASGMEFILQM